MLWTSDVPTTKLKWNYVHLEIKELWEEIKKLNIKGIINESCDVYTVCCCAFETTTGIPVPLLWERSAKEWVRRIEVWKSIFKDNNLEFKIEYIRYGGNHKKQWKVDKALQLAREDQGR